MLCIKYRVFLVLSGGDSYYSAVFKFQDFFKTNFNTLSHEFSVSVLLSANPVDFREISLVDLQF